MRKFCFSETRERGGEAHANGLRRVSTERANAA